jgi:hypothetical protein
MGEVHLDGEAAYLGFEDGMRDVFFAEKDLFDRAYLAAEDHIEVAVGSAGCAALAGVVRIRLIYLRDGCWLALFF